MIRVKCLVAGSHTYKNKTLPAQARREMRKLARNEHEAIVSIPEVVRLTIVSIEPTVIAVTLDIEQVEIAIGVVMYKIPSKPPLFDYTQS